MAHVCCWRFVHTFDNFFRPFFHKPEKLFEPYVTSGMTVMDIGCGAGFASIGLAKLVGDRGAVVSVDLQPEMLAIVKRRAEKQGLAERIQLHQCSTDAIGVENRFDFINAFWMVHEVPDTRRFLSQVRSYLHPEAKFLVAEPKFHVSDKKFDAMLEIASLVGFEEYARPKIKFSRAVVLVPCKKIQN